MVLVLEGMWWSLCSPAWGAGIPEVRLPPDSPEPCPNRAALERTFVLAWRRRKKITRHRHVVLRSGGPQKRREHLLIFGNVTNLAFILTNTRNAKTLLKTPKFKNYYCYYYWPSVISEHLLCARPCWKFGLLNVISRHILKVGISMYWLWNYLLQHFFRSLTVLLTCNLSGGAKMVPGVRLESEWTSVQEHRYFSPG